MSITTACLQFYERYAEKPKWRPGASRLSEDELRGVEATVGPILQELEELRRATLRKIDHRVMLMVPGGALAGAVLGSFVFQQASFLALFNFICIGGVLGWTTAFTSLSNAYRGAYKSLIIPHLAGRFGDLDYRAAREPNLSALANLGIVPAFGKKCVEDEIFGTYRGVALNIVEARLETGGKHSKVVFNGFLVELAVPDRRGTILVGRDGGMLANALRTMAAAKHLERVRLEDPRFEDLYQVYSDDQVAARALLTPAVMERLMALQRIAASPPCLVVDRGVLRISVATGENENSFEPPSIASPATSSSALLQLSADLGAVLKLIDAVLEISPATRPDAIAPGARDT